MKQKSTLKQKVKKSLLASLTLVTALAQTSYPEQKVSQILCSAAYDYDFLVDSSALPQIKRYRQLKLKPEEVCFPEDTAKPNAAIIYPSFDPEGKAFYNASALEFLAKIKSKYDTFVYVSKCGEDFYPYLSTLSEIELLVMMGHGSSRSLQLGPVQEYCEEEKNELNLSDQFLARYDFSFLTKDATIFLDSCSNAEGGRNADNFANFIASVSQRRVIASQTDFSASQIEITSLYPLDLRIVVAGQDEAYDTKKEVLAKGLYFIKD
ncbi:MAG TPA: hypothetical protein VJB13_03715 [Candidatus Nanoarchaeia archaeon]|nr:hypothetical protein [Candidatus Nanoarchaeia archaeon]